MLDRPTSAGQPPHLLQHRFRAADRLCPGRDPRTQLPLAAGRREQTSDDRGRRSGASLAAERRHPPGGAELPQGRFALLECAVHQPGRRFRRQRSSTTSRASSTLPAAGRQRPCCSSPSEWRRSARMASGMAHEFNNLMTIVLASLERAADEDGCQTRQGASRSNARTGARSATARLTSQMLSFARRQFHDNKESGGRRKLAARVRQYPGPDGGRRRPRDRSTCHRSRSWRRSMPDRWSSRLLNLVRNAADAMPNAAARSLCDPRPRILRHDCRVGRWSKSW